MAAVIGSWIFIIIEWVLLIIRIVLNVIVYVRHSAVLDEVGGTAYLAQLLVAMVGIINAGDYGRAIHDVWIRRQPIDIGEVMVNLGVEKSWSAKRRVGDLPALSSGRLGRRRERLAFDERPAAITPSAASLPFGRWRSHRRILLPGTSR